MSNIVLNYAKDTLLLGGYELTETTDLPHGWQLRCAGGEVVCVYRTGKIVAQGRGAAAVKALFKASPGPKEAAVAKPKTVAAETSSDASEDNQPSNWRRPEGWADEWKEGDVPF